MLGVFKGLVLWFGIILVHVPQITYCTLNISALNHLANNAGVFWKTLFIIPGTFISIKSKIYQQTINDH